MTLRCECGGALRTTEQSYSAETAFECYECEACGRTGTYSFGADGRDTTSGCVTADGGVP